MTKSHEKTEMEALANSLDIETGRKLIDIGLGASRRNEPGEARIFLQLGATRLERGGDLVGAEEARRLADLSS